MLKILSISLLALYIVMIYLNGFLKKVENKLNGEEGQFLALACFICIAGSENLIFVIYCKYLGKCLLSICLIMKNDFIFCFAFKSLHNSDLSELNTWDI